MFLIGLKIERNEMNKIYEFIEKWSNWFWFRPEREELKTAMKAEILGILESNWVELKSDYPDENEAVWAYNINTGYVALAVYVYDHAWFWAVSNGIIYNENGRIVTEAELDDDYEFTHFCRLPGLPDKREKEEKL